MKKIFLNIILIFFFTLSNAHINHYKQYKKIEMEIFRNNELIGYNNYFFTRNGDETLITNQIEFTVKILGANIFKIKGFGEEKYLKDQLISFQSKTLQNDKNKYVNLIFDKKKSNYNIKGSSYNGNASTDNVIGNWWNHKILQADSQISPISGSIKKQVISFIGKERIELYGKIYDVDHFKLQSKNMTLPKNKRLNFDIWVNRKNSMIIKVSYSRMGYWEYRLKSFE
tara:strand:+ start:2194 stop:2874 length:681 start_codon:yes stop_codon:yes gene_type:complete